MQSDADRQEIYAHISTVLRESRRAAGLTQREVATRAGCSIKTVSRYERSAKGMTIVELYDLAALLNVDFRKLMAEVEVMIYGADGLPTRRDRVL